MRFVVLARRVEEALILVEASSVEDAFASFASGRELRSAVVEERPVAARVDEPQSAEAKAVRTYNYELAAARIRVEELSDKLEAARASLKEMNAGGGRPAAPKKRATKKGA